MSRIAFWIVILCLTSSALALSPHILKSFQPKSPMYRFASLKDCQEKCVKTSGSTLKIRDSNCGETGTSFENGARVNVRQSSKVCRLGRTDYEMMEIGEGDHFGKFVAKEFLGECSGSGSGSSSSSDLCFPLKRGSFEGGDPRTNNERKFGANRGGGARCHAAYDLYTNYDDDDTSQSVAVADGQVVMLDTYWYSCAGTGKGKQNRVGAVMIYHPDLTLGADSDGSGYTINYGEIDEDEIWVVENQQIKKGQILGVHTGCGMVHFEIYKGKRTSTISWPKSNGVCNVDNPPTPLLNPSVIWSHIYTSRGPKYCNGELIFDHPCDNNTGKCVLPANCPESKRVRNKCGSGKLVCCKA